MDSLIPSPTKVTANSTFTTQATTTSPSIWTQLSSSSRASIIIGALGVFFFMASFSLCVWQRWQRRTQAALESSKRSPTERPQVCHSNWDGPQPNTFPELPRSNFHEELEGSTAGRELPAEEVGVEVETTDHFIYLDSGSHSRSQPLIHPLKRGTGSWSQPHSQSQSQLESPSIQALIKGLSFGSWPQSQPHPALRSSSNKLPTSSHSLDAQSQSQMTAGRRPHVSNWQAPANWESSAIAERPGDELMQRAAGPYALTRGWERDMI